jgi:hypothetical protein
MFTVIFQFWDVAYPNTGVHLGQLSASSHRNSAVLFNEPNVSELLRVHLLSQRESSEDNDVVIITAHWRSSSN